MPSYSGSDGTPLHYDDHGPADRPPVIVLAGGAARHPDYLGDLAGLTGRHRLVVPHLRGVGRSPAGPSGSYWDQADDLDELRRHLGRDRLVIAGHSAGTRLATAYAARFPERVAGLALITPPATHLVDTPPDAEELIARRRGEPVFDAAAAAAKAGPDLSGAEAFAAWFRVCAPLGYAAWGPAEQAHAAVGEFALPAMVAFFSVPPPADFAARLGRVTAPVLVVAGAEDCLTGLAPVVALAGLFPAGRAEVLPKCGHYPWVERPDEFRLVLDEYLSLVEVDHHLG
ncbi:pimeloyl-ACP methyl ester carboxylesterase [Actinoplanes octamycinicus]|uniref:Pimeloyl-ACP methyl ester carboxylesterase n=1 Tax=Actinoplanes octamycinicus TaxID=135948 RepID=A0A7W7GZ47_9ACTN|nr:alpha/beta hydrolase [Actinoplanes octamycinicus]MBB4740978.1 pimeloyl-ACP methyl ester carboxylesterase [Actinoplanes octamycinicus]GIE55885.1 hydrolase [Actinoplanes octamycinicus]